MECAVSLESPRGDGWAEVWRRCWGALGRVEEECLRLGNWQVSPCEGLG